MFAFVAAVSSALLVSFLCSISEATLLSVSHAQIEALGMSRAGQILRHFKREVDVPLAAILILNTLANTMGASVAGATYGLVFEPSTLWIFSLIFAGAILLLAEIIPKTLGVVFVVRLAPYVAHFVNTLVWLLTPLLFLTRAISGLLRRGNAQPVTSVEEIRLLGKLGKTEGVVGAGMASIIDGAANLHELTAYDIMVSRGAVVAVSGKRSLDENLKIMLKSGHSRFPFTETGDLDHVSGVVLVKELMFQLQKTPRDPHWENHAGRQLIVPGAMPLDRLLLTFQEKRRHLAIVVDEYGGTQGICTLEDVLEEIVGEIEDETDHIDAFIEKRPDGRLKCRGWAETRKVFEMLGVDEDVEAVTIGGFVAEQVGRVPRAGDVVRFEGFEFRVTAASVRRAERVEVRPLVSEAPPK